MNADTGPSGGDSDATLWVSSNPPWGVVRAVVAREPYAAVLDDLNGDEREVSADLFRRRDDRWEWLISQDDAGIPGRRGQGAYSGWNDGVFYAMGRGRPGDSVRLPRGARASSVRCDEDGWWLYVEEDISADLLAGLDRWLPDGRL